MSARVTSADSPPCSRALVGAELEQHDDLAEIAEQVSALPRRGEVVGHRHRQRDPGLVEDQQVKQADHAAGGAVAEPLVAHDLGAFERVEQLLDASFAHLPAGGERVVGDADGAVLAVVALLVGQLAEQRVEADRAQPPRPAGALANRLYGVHADLKERQLAPIADADAGVGYLPGRWSRARGPRSRRPRRSRASTSTGRRAGASVAVWRGSGVGRKELPRRRVT